MGKNYKAAVSYIIFLLLVAVQNAESQQSGGHTEVQSESKQPSGGGHKSSNLSPPSSSTGAVALCQKVRFKETCERSVADAKSGNPKDLIQHAFNYAVANIGDVLSKSKTIQDAAKDPNTSKAFDLCKLVFNKAIFDFNRSISRVQSLDFSDMDTVIGDLRSWISATISVHTICLDAFEDTPGDSGAKMKELLKTAKELSVNAMGMVNAIAKIFAAFDFQGSGTGSSARSMLDEMENPTTRRLMQASPASLTPNVVVAQDGSGQYKTIMEAINTVPPGNNKPYVIHIKAGVYYEYVEVPDKVNFVVLVGDGIGKTKITGNKNRNDGSPRTWTTATVGINGGNCLLRDMTIENSAGAIKEQAVALRVSGDSTVVYNSQIDGYQDTLYCALYRQFYRDVTITGTIDFLFGDGLAIYQNCKMIVRAPMEKQGCMVTAQGRETAESNGAIVLQNCSIVGDPGYYAMNPRPKAYLGRPWHILSRTIIMESFIDGLIDPAGWSPWAGTVYLDTCYYAEYKNRGPGSQTSNRVTWKGIQWITPEMAASWTGDTYIDGSKWVPATGVPYVGAMMNV